MRVFVRHSFGPALLLASALALGACDSADVRAENHYQRGMALLAEGDVDRAMVEFRNVFRLNGSHTPARLQYARLLRDRGDMQGALGQYLRLVEEDSDSVEGLKDLTELAVRMQDLGTARTHSDLAYALAPLDPDVRALKATLDFGLGGSSREAALEMARGVLAEVPDNLPSQMVLIADRLRSGDPQGALDLVDAAIERTPGDEGLRVTRIAALEQLGENAAVGAELRRMVELFPENAGARQGLIQWYLREGDTDTALVVLRDIAATQPDDPKGYLSVVQFRFEIEGAAAARAELDQLIATQPDPRPFQQALAGLDFAEGRRAEAIAALGALVEGAEPSDAIRDTQVVLAGMLDATGEAARRDALIETVLAGDPAHVGALKLRARVSIAADQPERAIQDMRTALAQAPRDPEIMTIMAFAHEREGSRELAGERFALAVETSNYGPQETLRYARFLLQDRRTGPAEGVVVDALRRSPADPGLLEMLGRIHLERGDWARARQVAGLLRQQGDPAAARVAADLETASLRGEDRRDDTVALLEGLAAEGGDTRAMAQLLQTHVEAGDLDAAQTYLDGVLAAEPDSMPARQMLAGLKVMQGDYGGAESLYRELIAGAPAVAQPYQALAALLAGMGRGDEALGVLDAGLAATGEDPGLLFIKAGLVEGRGDYEGAIGIYEALYARDTSSAVIANNLASLLTSQRDDAASLERAFTIARRLRTTDVPHFQETYGWILHLRGDSAQALDYLEPAARALSDNALVQFHLAEAQLATGRTAEARASFVRAVDLAGPGAALPQARLASARIVEIDARPAAGGDTETEG